MAGKKTRPGYRKIVDNSDVHGGRYARHLLRLMRRTVRPLFTVPDGPRRHYPEDPYRRFRVDVRRTRLLGTLCMRVTVVCTFAIVHAGGGHEYPCYRRTLNVKYTRAYICIRIFIYYVCRPEGSTVLFYDA